MTVFQDFFKLKYSLKCKRVMRNQRRKLKGDGQVGQKQQLNHSLNHDREILPNGNHNKKSIQKDNQSLEEVLDYQDHLESFHSLEILIINCTAVQCEE